MRVRARAVPKGGRASTDAGCGAGRGVAANCPRSPPWDADGRARVRTRRVRRARPRGTEREEASPRRRVRRVPAGNHDRHTRAKRGGQDHAPPRAVGTDGPRERGAPARPRAPRRVRAQRRRLRRTEPRLLLVLDGRRDGAVLRELPPQDAPRRRRRRCQGHRPDGPVTRAALSCRRRLRRSPLRRNIRGREAAACGRVRGCGHGRRRRRGPLRASRGRAHHGTGRRAGGPHCDRARATLPRRHRGRGARHAPPAARAHVCARRPVSVSHAQRKGGVRGTDGPHRAVPEPRRIPPSRAHLSGGVRHSAVRSRADARCRAALHF